MNRFFSMGAPCFALAFGLASQFVFAQQSSPVVQPSKPQTATKQGTRPPPPPVVAKPEELAKVREKTEQIEALVNDLKSKQAKPELLADVAVYAKAGRMLLEFPDMFGTQAAIEHSFLVLDQRR